MKIETRFSIGDEIFGVTTENVTDTCPNCEGVGHFFFKDGRAATKEFGGKCFQCDGKGARKVGDRWIPRGPFKIGVIHVREISQHTLDDIEPHVIYFSETMAGPSAPGDRAFANSVAADLWCHEENKKPKEEVPV